jgi:hypothetical protein
MGPYTPSTKYNLDTDPVLNFYNDVYNDITKFNLDKENSISNLYVYKKTKMINKILYITIITCVIIILLTFINKTYTYFDDVAYLIMCGILVGGAIIYIGYILWDLYFRSNLNFDEYDYNKFGTYNPSKISPNVYKDYSDISGANIKGPNTHGSVCSSSINDSTNKSFFKQLF